MLASSTHPGLFISSLPIHPADRVQDQGNHQSTLCLRPALSNPRTRSSAGRRPPPALCPLPPSCISASSRTRHTTPAAAFHPPPRLPTLSTLQFEKVIKAYTQKKALAVGLIRFVYDGNRVETGLTPADLDMEDGDVIDAILEQTGGSCSNACSAGGGCSSARC